MTAVENITLADDASSICTEVVNRYFMPEVRYNHDAVPAIITTISDLIVRRLTQEAKLPRKYIAHVAILQKNGAGIYAISACAWNPSSDACYVHQAENKAMYCILTIYGITM